MSIGNGILLLVMIWFLIFMLAMMIPTRSQAEQGEVVPGTPASAPSKVNLARRARFTTVLALVVFGLIWAVIRFDLIHAPTLNDLPMAPPAGAAGSGG
ncbi:MAG: DUF1467 family protein [Paracoccaceae bacterium]|nr:DUF1467 family protein [Paracoccaceae bacterium]